jgi:hypothetical protein
VVRPLKTVICLLIIPFTRLSHTVNSTYHSTPPAAINRIGLRRSSTTETSGALDEAIFVDSR